MYSKDKVIQEFSDLEPFIKRQEINVETMSVLNKYKERLLHHLSGISISQQGAKKKS